MKGREPASKIPPEEKQRRVKLSIIILIILLAVLSVIIYIGRDTPTSSLNVEFTVRMLDDENYSTRRDNNLIAGKEALLTFMLKDNRTGQFISGLDPEISFYIPGEHDPAREHKHFGEYHLTNELNMAKLQLFVLNSERGTIEVLDTFGGYDPRPQAIKSMGTMTSKVIRLKGSAADLLAGMYGDYIYATLPKENQVAVVNTISHEVVRYIDVGSNPDQMFLQPKSKFLWISITNGVSIIDTASNSPVKTIDTGKGHHEIAFSPENAYITNSQDNIISVVRLADLKKREEIKVQGMPYGIDYSNASNEIYVTNALSGTLTVIDARKNNIKKHIPLSTGVEFIKFSPDGSRCVVLNKYENSAYIVDAAVSSVIKTVKTGEMPSTAGFLEEYALIRNTYSNDVTYISMLDPEISNNELIGNEPPLNATQRSLLSTSYGDEVVVTSPRDGKLFFIHKMNGQPMAMNSVRVEFGSDAVVMVENKLHETSPGVYQQYIKLDREGTYVVEFRTQKMNASFKIEVLPRQTTGVITTALFKNMTFMPGRASTLQYQITDGKTGKPEENLTDLIYVVIKPSSTKGVWTKRFPSKHAGSGIYEAKIIFPEEGDYMVTLNSNTLSRKGYRTAYDYITVRTA